MALAPLASVADLEAREIDVTNATRVAAALDSASAAVRDAAGCPITALTSTITLPGVDGPWLRLPGGPITEVTSVLVDGVAVTYKQVGDSLWRACGWQGCEPSLVTITMTHGLAACPDDIVDLVCNLVGASLAVVPGERVGVESEAIDDHRVTYAQGEDATVSVLELPQRTRDMLRARFAGTAETTGTR